jgi:hypothetical protein
MRNWFKTYTSVFFLFLFLLLTIGKGIHSHHPIGETNVYTSGTQFQVQEDRCLICDFTITDSNTPVPASYCYVVSETYFSFQTFIEAPFLQEAFLHLSSRAPPAMA